MQGELQKMLAGELYEPLVCTVTIPDGVFAAGNPCRVIRQIPE